MVEEHCLPIPQFCPERSSRGSMRHFSLTAPAFIESVAELPVMHELHSKIDRGGRFIDVGAHIGFYTVAFSNCFDVVTSFEPSKFQYGFLKRNIEINSLSQCKALPVALGRRPSRAKMTVTGRTGGTNTLMELGPDFDAMDQYEVQVARLDDYRFSDVSFMKIDVEGWELEVLAGAIKTLKSSRPMILIEIWDDSEQRRRARMFFEGLGYRLAFPFSDFPEIAMASP